MNGTYGKLCDRVIKDVERVGSSKVAGNLEDQRSRVYHTGFDNQDEDFRDTKVTGYTRDHTEYIPNNGVRDLFRISTRTRTHQTLRAMREATVMLVAREKLNTRPFQIARVRWNALWMSCPLAKW